ncbi:zinc-binding dehydrogenase [Streptomyces sp. NPDC050504]|uniref:zinc-binding dehydrogenase n=1 Tax=Streptomyces sp. NPDC050504 TaxID=3365618 RepID=UPI0037B15E72
MRVIHATEFGGPEVLVPTEVPDAAAGPGEVVIAVSAVDTIFLETQLRAGDLGDYFRLEPPYVPGSGVAGTVRSVGAGVDPGWIGRRVVSSSVTDGSYTELAVSPAAGLTPVPDGLADEQAAALVHDGVTAARLLELVAVRPGERVLVVGASGGMGTLLVQQAKAAGAVVVALARGGRKLALVRELGADAAVDTGRAGWQEAAREALGGAGADVVLDGVGGEVGRAAYALTADGGRFSAHGAPTGDFARVDAADAERRGIAVLGIGDVQLSEADRSRLAARALAEAAAGRLRTVIGGTFPLERAGAAHAAIEGRGLLGKVVLTVP